jgi:hypothetical protein
MLTFPSQAVCFLCVYTNDEICGSHAISGITNVQLNRSARRIKSGVLTLRGFFILVFRLVGCTFSFKIKHTTAIYRDDIRSSIISWTFRKRVCPKPKRDDVLTAGWKKLYNEELHDLYSSPTIVRVIKSRRMRLTGHVSGLGRGEACTGF